ncbi:MAG: Dyp-type peroxidase [Polyangiaceae bacterium]
MAEIAVNPPLERKDIQGIVLFGYGSLPSARFYFLHIEDAAQARRWLRESRKRVRHAGDDHRDWHTALNLGFTVAGLRALGVDEDTLCTFPREMQQTMADEERALVLGDEEESAPTRWELGGPAGTELHAVALVYGRSAAEVADTAVSLGLEDQARSGASVATCIESQRIGDGREHFGFRDGLSQPHVLGMPVSTRDAEYQSGPAVAAGEFVLGYPNEYQQLPLSPSVHRGHPGADALPPLAHAADSRHDLGKNGSYLVLRKLQQHVSVFWNAMREHGGEEGAASLGERIVGRKADGPPLEGRPNMRPNDFDFSDDVAGDRCPIGAHIRRANPRAALARELRDPREQARELERATKTLQRHRLLRRGRPYGAPLDDPRGARDDDGVDRGLIFAVINTNIARQFEFVQQTWMNSTKFDGLYDEDDPLVGQRRNAASFTLPGSPSPRRIRGLPRFVTMRGGGYFFLPSMTALDWLGDPERG